jgi:hypothetical protein
VAYRDAGTIQREIKRAAAGIRFKEVIFQGRGTGSVFLPFPGVSKQVAEIVLTDKAAQFAARVSRDDKPAGGAQLVFPGWPLARFEDYPVAPADFEKRDMPGVIEDWLTRGEAVALEDGEAKTIRIEMTSAP